MRFCKVCGNGAEDDAVFCMECGNKLSAPDDFSPEDEFVQEVYGPPSMMGNSVIVCKYCGTERSADLPFCMECGEGNRQMKCTDCGYIYIGRAGSSCPRCGRKEGVRSERKPIPVLYGPPRPRSEDGRRKTEKKKTAPPFRPDLESIPTVYGPPPVREKNPETESRLVITNPKLKGDQK